MPLRVKEIFKTDLDPNSANWWAKDKVDKLNFNFNQFKDGGAPGPFGKDGADGETGEMGPQGLEGAQGPFGAQGFEGLPGESYWKKLDGINNSTLFPYPLLNDQEIAAIPTIIGAKNDPDVSNEYSEVIDFNDPHLSILTINALFIDDTLGLVKSNITFRTEDSQGEIHPMRSRIKLYDNPADGSDSLYFGKYSEAVDDKLDIGIDVTTTNYNNYYITGQGQPNELSLNITHEPAGDRFLKSYNTTELQQKVQVNGDFVYNNTPIDEGILVSTDNDGNVEWKNRGEFFGALPQGSIVSISHDDFFNDVNFDLTPGFTVNPSTGVLEFTYGRGKPDGDFKGWYICNGVTWQQDGLVTFEVPNLNSAEYQINTGGFTTGQEDDSNVGHRRILIASSEVSVDAIFDSVEGTYDVSLTTDTTESTFTPAGGTSFKINNEVKIINLVEKTLHWETGDVNAIQPDPISLSTGGLITDACDGSPSNYEWTGGTDLTIWSDFNNSLSGIQLYQNINGQYSSAPSGWYQLFTGVPLEGTGYLRYWNGIEFTNTDQCPLQVTINLADDTNITNLNGYQSSGTDYIINDLSFLSATELRKYDGTLADSGWYKETGTSGVKYSRYWDKNNSEFKGETIPRNYVYQLSSTVYLSQHENSSACSINTQYAYVYYAKSTLESSPYELSDAQGNQVYVHLDWLGQNAGESPLVGIANQNRPNGTSPYKSLLQETFGSDLKRSLITQQSSITSITQCITPSYFTIGSNPTQLTSYSITPQDNVPQSGISGIFYVNNPADISLTASSTSFAEVAATMQITSLGVHSVSAINGTDNHTITSNSTGSYSFTIFPSFGGASAAGNLITISIVDQ